MKRFWLPLLALLANGGLAPPAAAAEPVAAVLSSQTGPYREALAGLRQELGESVPSFSLSEGKPQIPGETRVVIAFGSKAAQQSYARQIVLIYALAPGMVIKTRSAIKIHLEPAAATLLANLKKIHPRLKRLGILWESPQFEKYGDELSAAADAQGMTIEGVALQSSADIPDELRGLYGKIDAIWLPPDPMLLNAESLPVFVEFSRSNGIPLFVPTGGLVEQGATASVGSTFREMGRLAGVVARKALEGAAQEGKLHPANVEIVISKSAAARVGLVMPEETLRQADKVLP